MKQGNLTSFLAMNLFRGVVADPAPCVVVDEALVVWGDIDKDVDRDRGDDTVLACQQSMIGGGPEIPGDEAAILSVTTSARIISKCKLSASMTDMYPLQAWA